MKPSWYNAASGWVPGIVDAGRLAYQALGRRTHRLRAGAYQRRPGRMYGAVKAGRGTAGQKALRMVKQLAKQQELKRHPTTDAITTTAAATTWDLTYCSGMAQGDTSLTREGLHINVGSFRLRGYLRKADATTSGSVRVLVIKDRASNGGQPSQAAVMMDTSFESGYNFVPPYNGRFQILMDRTFHFQVDDQVKQFKFYKKGPWTMHYSGTTSAYTSQASGGLWVAIMGKEDNTATVTCDTNTMLRFTD